MIKEILIPIIIIVINTILFYLNVWDVILGFKLTIKFLVLLLLLHLLLYLGIDKFERFRGDRSYSLKLSGFIRNEDNSYSIIYWEVISILLNGTLVILTILSILFIPKIISAIYNDSYEFKDKANSIGLYNIIGDKDENLYKKCLAKNLYKKFPDKINLKLINKVIDRNTNIDDLFEMDSIDIIIDGYALKNKICLNIVTRDTCRYKFESQELAYYSYPDYSMNDIESAVLISLCESCVKSSDLSFRNKASELFNLAIHKILEDRSRNYETNLVNLYLTRYKHFKDSIKLNPKKDLLRADSINNKNKMVLLCLIDYTNLEYYSIKYDPFSNRDSLLIELRNQILTYIDRFKKIKNLSDEEIAFVNAIKNKY